MPLALVLSAALGFATGPTAQASDPFPVRETFTGPTLGSQWRNGGSAELTGAREAEGWLRLTSAEGGEFGYAYDNEAFPATEGALIEFEYADWGGSGADGLTFFLFDGATSEAEFHAGQPGGALGYAPCLSTTNGLSNAYVGVGFDEYGNFTNLGSICGLDGTQFLANHVSVRGAASENYKLLASAATAESLRAERSQARRVTIAVTPTGKLSVYVGYPDGTYQQVTEDFQLPAAPDTLKFGYVASTGALTDYHEIRDAQVVKPTQLTPSVIQTAGGDERGEPLTWTAVVRNEGPNPTQREQLRTTTRGQALLNVTWTCEAAGGAECGITEGTGMPSPEGGAMPQGSSLTYKITGTPTATTDYAQVTVESEPRGDTGELDPEAERATVRTDLTPLFEQEPSFTLTADGEADATTASALGGEISYSYAWQRCEASGTACADIPGAQSPAYHTTGADTGHTIRFSQTASNSAGSATIDSAVYQLPTTEIISQPAPYVATREAAVSFAASSSEATLECSLDGAAWGACTSPLSYPGLADGEHTFSVRAAYGGLRGPEPSSARWTVEATPPPAPSIVSAPSSPSALLDPMFEFGGLVESDVLECQLDGGEWMPCEPTTEFTGLTKGEHRLQARQANRAGLDSDVTGFEWEIDTVPTPPLTPIASVPENTPPLATPAPENMPSSAGTTLECSLDGRPYVACASNATPTGLSAGWHTLTVRKMTAAGVITSSTTRRWRVAGGHARSRKAHPHVLSHERTATARHHGAEHKHKAAARKRKAQTRRHVLKEHKRKAKARRRGLKHRRRVAGRRHAAKHRTSSRRQRGAARQRKAGKRPPSRKPQPKATARRRSSKGNEPPPAATHTRKHEIPPPAVAPAPRDKPRTAKPTPKSSPPARTRKPTTRAQPPAAARQPESTPPARTITRSPVQAHPRHTTRHAPRDRERHHRAKPRSMRTRGAGEKPKHRTHTPATTHAPKRKAHAPATTPRPNGKTHAPASRRTSKRKHPVHRGVRGVGAKLVIRPFLPRSSALVGRARRLIKRVATSAAHARLIVCVGYTDNLGARSVNLALGLARARAVCAKLRALGVHATFKAESRGPERPCASNATARGRALNRRVEVRISY
jgi:outer membrane protein OmpA-like peptidoglycan-associated protein